MEVELGFVVKSQNDKLASHYFPSKVGGMPAWLALKNIPHIRDLTCQYCNEPGVFLVQIYAPIDDNVRSFHRTIYIIMCLNAACCQKGSFIVLRSQLPRNNDFYSSEPPESEPYGPRPPNASDYQSLCAVCGCNGPKKCSNCKVVSYCSKEHQILHWKSNHKNSCNKEGANTSDLKLLLPEWEIITETEELIQVQEKTEEEKMAEYRDALKENESSLMEGTSTTDLDNMAQKEEMEDQVFQQFKERISHDPEQVLRYQRGGTPLYVSDKNQPTADDIPPCSCGRKRIFEFQIMPQLLNYLDVDSVGESVDWGTLIVYTCEANCEPKPEAPYAKEFLWKQDFADINNAK